MQGHSVTGKYTNLYRNTSHSFWRPGHSVSDTYTNSHRNTSHSCGRKVIVFQAHILTFKEYQSQLWMQGHSVLGTYTNLHRNTSHSCGGKIIVFQAHIQHLHRNSWPCCHSIEQGCQQWRYNFFNILNIYIIYSKVQNRVHKNEIKDFASR